MISTRRIDDSGAIDPPIESLSELYDELKSSDQEHGDVSVTDENTGWSISAHRDGRVVLVNLIEGGGRHMHPVSKEKVLELWGVLASGGIERILSEPWRDGYVSKA
jgi:hypothetical protein